MRLTTLAVLILTLASCSSLNTPIDRAGERAEEAVRLAGEEMRALTTESINHAAEEAKAIIQSATEAAADTVDRATESFERTGTLLVERTGSRLDESINLLGDRTDEAVDRLGDRTDQAVDRAGDRAEVVVGKTGEVASKAREDAEGFLDYVKDWWGLVVGVLTNAVIGIFLIRARIKATNRQRTLRAVVGAVDRAGADQVRAFVKETLGGHDAKTAKALRDEIAELRRGQT